jgi:hypothetical protein
MTVSADHTATLAAPATASVDAGERTARLDANVPAPPSERGVWLLALALALLGTAVLAVALARGSSEQSPQPSPPAVLSVAATPTPTFAPGRTLASAATATASTATHAATRATRTPATPHAIVAKPTAEQQQLDALRFIDSTQTHITARWVAGFYPLYAIAQRTFGVNWLLLASIHRQESAFSTARGTYEGLNFAHCCGGPMQFNVTNGPVTTWALVSDSFRYGTRPAAYDHQTAKHPSIYDDFDAMMGAAHLLSADGAGYALDYSAWIAAYDYYGHDPTGVTYADQVLARAIGWSQHGFCINCGVETRLVEAVQAAYGAPVQAALERAAVESAAKLRAQKRAAKPRPK